MEHDEPKRPASSSTKASQNINKGKESSKHTQSSLVTSSIGRVLQESPILDKADHLCDRQFESLISSLTFSKKDIPILQSRLSSLTSRDIKT
eukprot:Nk52_evm2s2596 gene=Nk52_evmTU2s2596